MLSHPDPTRDPTAHSTPDPTPGRPTGTTSGTSSGTPSETAPAPDAAFTRSGRVDPPPGAAPNDVPAYYDDDCQVREGDGELRLGCVYGDEDGAVTVALTGDSKAGQWFEALDRIAEAHGWRLELYLKSACALNPKEKEADCLAFNESVMDHLTSPSGRVDYVLTSALLAGSGADHSYAAAYDAYWTRLEAVGSKVIAISDTPQPGGDEPRYECVEQSPEDFLDCAFPANDGLGSGPLHEAVQLGSSRTWLDLNPWVCPRTPDDRCPVVVGNMLVYRQGSHVTRTYVESMTPLIEAELVKAGVLERRSPEVAATAGR